MEVAGCCLPLVGDEKANNLEAARDLCPVIRISGGMCLERWVCGRVVSR